MSNPLRTWRELPEEERDHLLELASTIILSVTVVLTAFSAWEATLWGGEQSLAYARAGSARTSANAALITASTQKNYDVTSFVNGVIEYFQGNDEVVDYFRQDLIRDEFKPSVEAWLALNPRTNPQAPDTPFDMPQYSNAKEDEAEALSGQAEEELVKGDSANQNGDNYVLVTVFYATVLFFTGIVTKLKSDGLRFVSMAMAAIALIGATVFMLTLPRLLEM